MLLPEIGLSAGRKDALKAQKPGQAGLLRDSHRMKRWGEDVSETEDDLRHRCERL